MPRSPLGRKPRRLVSGSSQLLRLKPKTAWFVRLDCQHWCPVPAFGHLCLVLFCFGYPTTFLRGYAESPMLCAREFVFAFIVSAWVVFSRIAAERTCELPVYLREFARVGSWLCEVCLRRQRLGLGLAQSRLNTLSYIFVECVMLNVLTYCAVRVHHCPLCVLYCAGAEWFHGLCAPPRRYASHKEISKQPRTRAKSKHLRV